MAKLSDVEDVGSLIKDAYEMGWADSKKYAGETVEATVKWKIENGVWTPTITPRPIP